MIMILVFAGVAVFGLCIFALGIVLHKKINHGPSDKELDAQAIAIFDDMDSYAFKKLGIDKSEVSLVEPVKFWGYQFCNPSVHGDGPKSMLGDELNETAGWIKGRDGIVRSSEITITGFILAKIVSIAMSGRFLR